MKVQTAPESAADLGLFIFTQEAVIDENADEFLAERLG